ncbi:MAG: NAD(P)H-hydrate dehydratase, partial [Acetobacteraceae bacterium]|nr:NAD(P)H-hydrate dehydratase [Acetobacteraceae bacterium]
RRLTVDVVSRLELPAVLDAGALGCVPHLSEHAPSVRIITPHAGEMAKLLDCKREEVEADPAAAGREAASRYRCIVVMKGAQTQIVEPGGTAYLFTGGTVGLATSGSGDTLAGVTVALLARGTPPVWAAIWGVFLHGEAGTRLFRRYGGIGFLAREIPGEVPRIMAEFAPAAD